MDDLLIDKQIRHSDGRAVNGKVRRIDDKTIHIKVPASVAYNIKSMQKVTETVLNRLGCPGCHSGYDLRFDFERNFIFDENIEIIRG